MSIHVLMVSVECRNMWKLQTLNCSKSELLESRSWYVLVCLGMSWYLASSGSLFKEAVGLQGSLVLP